MTDQLFQLYGGEKNETLSNVMMLQLGVHRAWDKAQLIILPIDFLTPGQASS